MFPNSNNNKNNNINQNRNYNNNNGKNNQYISTFNVENFVYQKKPTQKQYFDRNKNNSQS